MKEGGFIWYELMTSDTGAAAAFYGTVIGWTAKKADNTTAGGMDYTTFHVPGYEAGTAGMMAITPDMAKNGVRTAWVGYVCVDDVDAKANDFWEAGGRVHMPATDISGIGRFAVVADPHGAVLYLFKPQMPDGPVPEMPKMPTPGTFGWHELYAGDGPEAFDFYARMFRWKKGQGMDMGPMGTYQLFQYEGADLGGIMTKMPDMPVPFWNYYICVDAIDAANDRVEAAGGKVVNGPMEVPGGSWIIQCLDPQGATFALVAPKR
jgi:uncharacterized protein